MHNFGFAVTYFPKFLKSKKLSLNSNILFFWRACTSLKFDAENNRILDEKASKYLGTECNVLMGMELLKDFRLFSNFAIFFPGDFYKDIKGIKLYPDVYSKLNPAIIDRYNLKAKDYRLSNDTAWFLRIGVRYDF